ncbi:protein-L-isoaspartate O-methyltransferase [Stakelama sp. CBK3Z-3]|uniref:Protein-L-isoaspartate O-methyltransferase n=1 Tax=Stakelama flava TaxID=2860338 RepID=A0ABS6XKT5_9SPHN|nr:protein-L-isoaspartate O-methyltransferase [Stakelama flava]MBW4330817.1 protein-L-isoaspartate O-methyltransferase [Stakelama flava]
MMNKSADPSSFETMRRAMVSSQLRTSAVDDTRVIEAMAVVPRERYVPAGVRDVCYRDTQLALCGGRFQNTPLATGRLINEAWLKKSDKVLLIGAASGYTAAVLALIVDKVVALEEDEALAGAAGAALTGIGNVELVTGPLNAGWNGGAPYNAIIVDGAVEKLPPEIIAQAAPGARISTGLVDRGVTRLAAGSKTEGGFGLFDFADSDCCILPGFAAPHGFRF